MSLMGTLPIHNFKYILLTLTARTVTIGEKYLFAYPYHTLLCDVRRCSYHGMSLVEVDISWRMFSRLMHIHDHESSDISSDKMVYLVTKV